MNYPDRIELVLTDNHDSEDTEPFTERADAEKFGDYYISTPFAFAQNLAYGDILKVEYDDGEYHFDELVEEASHSVVHIFVFKPESKVGVIITLSEFYCSVNTYIADNYLFISIPPTVLCQPLQTYLFNEEFYSNTSFRESCLSRLHAPAQN